MRTCFASMKNEKIILENDIKVFGVRAASYPEGIQQAHNTLRAILPASEGRIFYGLSRPENEGGIIYRAAANEITEGELRDLNLETVVIRKGAYISIFIADYAGHIEDVGNAFSELLSFPGIDPEGYCVERYEGDKDVTCMVRLQ